MPQFVLIYQSIYFANDTPFYVSINLSILLTILHSTYKNINISKDNHQLQITNEHLLDKFMYLSHFILKRVGVSVVCESRMETGTDCYIDPTSSPDHSTTTSASWLGLLNRVRWGGGHSNMALTLAFLSPTNSTIAGTCLYSFIRPLASASSSAYLHRCMS